MSTQNLNHKDYNNYNKFRKPEWIKNKLNKNHNNNDNDNLKSRQIKQIIHNHNLKTVCTQARCPNRSECFSRGVATFLIMGQCCTRGCKFCNIRQKKMDTLDPIKPLDNNEPHNVANAIKIMGLRHAVITSVTRDDIPDYGANHFKETIQQINRVNPNLTIEILPPDFNYIPDLYLDVAAEKLLVYNHNIESVERLFPQVRDNRFDYHKSLGMLSDIKSHYPRLITKSGFMVGLGETIEDIESTLTDLHRANVSIVTIGQYLPPSRDHYPLDRFVHPEEFAQYKLIGEQLGIDYIFAGPLVRSSYIADAVLENYMCRDMTTASNIFFKLSK